MTLAPVQDARVSFRLPGRAPQVRSSDAEGRVTLDRPPEKLDLVVESDGHHRYARAVRPGRGEMRRLEVMLGPTDTATMDDRILCVHQNGIWGVDPQTQAFTPLATPDGHPLASPSWHPDRTRFACLERIPNGTRILIRHADGRPLRALGPVADAVDQLRWVPDGKALVMTQAASTNNRMRREIRIVDAFTGAQRDLVSAGTDQDPAWARDGSWLAWARLFPGRTWELWRRHAATGHEQPLLRGFNAVEPSWSPDGRRMVFASNREGTWALYEMAVEAPQPTRATRLPDGVFARRPAFAPYGSHVVFETNLMSGGPSDGIHLAILDLVRGRLRPLVADAHHASW
ncbi:MAG: hypothetical protein VKO21_01335 [Candidatus Sericytochromatia bacterium]|nr:hypothetical protein [Candidatus Sericytochromatia bacterium]